MTSKLQWQKAPYKSTTNRDCFVDVSATLIFAGSGRWYIKQIPGRHGFYMLKFNGRDVKRFELLAQAKQFAEDNTRFTPPSDNSDDKPPPPSISQ